MKTLHSIQKLEDMFVDEGTAVIMNCTLSSQPQGEHTIVWLKDNKQISNTADYNIQR